MNDTETVEKELTPKQKAWRRYYAKNKQDLHRKSREWAKAHPERTTEIRRKSDEKRGVKKDVNRDEGTTEGRSAG